MIEREIKVDDFACIWELASTQLLLIKEYWCLVVAQRMKGVFALPIIYFSCWAKLLSFAFVNCDFKTS